MTVRIKRVYDAPEASDGMRILVDRLWPRGIAKEKARIDLWLKDISPSDDLRRRFHARPESWDEFRTLYAEELEGDAGRIAASGRHRTSFLIAGSPTAASRPPVRSAAMAIAGAW